MCWKFRMYILLTTQETKKISLKLWHNKTSFDFFQCLSPFPDKSPSFPKEFLQMNHFCACLATQVTQGNRKRETVSCIAGIHSFTKSDGKSFSHEKLYPHQWVDIRKQCDASMATQDCSEMMTMVQTKRQNCWHREERNIQKWPNLLSLHVFLRIRLSWEAWEFQDKNAKSAKEPGRIAVKLCCEQRLSIAHSWLQESLDHSLMSVSSSWDGTLRQKVAETWNLE